MVLIKPDQGASLGLADYESHYEFKITTGTIPALEDVVALEKSLKNEPFKERRKILQATARTMRELAELSAEETHIVRYGRRQRSFSNVEAMWTAPEGLYVGGLEETVAFTWDLTDEEKRAEENLKRQEAEARNPDHSSPRLFFPFDPSTSNVQVREGLYTGPLPAWVTNKYKAARDVFGADHLCVVSRNAAFFKVNVLPREASPMLLGFHEKMGKVYLLAAWGLEYELPKSLGGLLDD